MLFYPMTPSSSTAKLHYRTSPHCHGKKTTDCDVVGDMGAKDSLPALQRHPRTMASGTLGRLPPLAITSIHIL